MRKTQTRTRRIDWSREEHDERVRSRLMAASPFFAEPAQRPSATSSLRGLSEAEVARRRAAGEGAVTALPTSRSYLVIIRANVFDFVTTILFSLGLARSVPGRPTVPHV